MKDEELNLQEIEVSHALGGEVEASFFFLNRIKKTRAEGETM